MRLSVRFNGKWYVIPCGDGVNSIHWLIEETIRRSKEHGTVPANNFEAVLAQSDGKLHLKDPIREVLNDSDFVYISGEIRHMYWYYNFGIFYNC